MARCCWSIFRETLIRREKSMLGDVASIRYDPIISLSRWLGLLLFFSDRWVTTSAPISLSTKCVRQTDRRSYPPRRYQRCAVEERRELPADGQEQMIGRANKLWQQYPQLVCSRNRDRLIIRLAGRCSPRWGKCKSIVLSLAKLFMLPQKKQGLLPSLALFFTAGCRRSLALD